MKSIQTLANEYHRYREDNDHQRLLWRGDLDHISQWEDTSPDAIEARQKTLRSYADKAEKLLKTSEDVADIALLETIAFTGRSAANQLQWRSELEFPNPEIGLHALLLTFLPRYPLVTQQHGAEYLEKLRRLPRLLDEVSTALLSANQLPLKRHLVLSIAKIDAHFSRQHDPLRAQAPPTELSNLDAALWESDLSHLLIGDVRPAIGRYRDAMATVADSARPDTEPGLVHLEGGAEHYRDLVWSHTSLELDGEEVHEIGLQQVARLEDEYLEIAAPVLGTTDITEIYARLRDDAGLRYRDGQSLVADAEDALARAAAVAPDWFAKLPESPCIASEIGQGALAFYSKPIPSVGKPGQFFFNTSDPSAWSTFQLRAVTYHESIPGHHLQLALVTESPDIHGVHTDLPVTAYSEGWGLYTERLADEMGLYPTEMDRIGMLSADSMRACRLVTDTGIHALGWTRDQAIQYILDHSPLSRRIAEGEIDRYIGHPGQALAYMIGRLEIDRIRAEAESHPGFDIKDFHDRVLRNGAVPLQTLRRLVLSE